jgi:hypothetical protein
MDGASIQKTKKILQHVDVKGVTGIGSRIGIIPRMGWTSARGLREILDNNVFTL